MVSRREGGHPDGMELREFGPDDTAAVATYVDIQNACLALDSPWRPPATEHGVAMSLTHGWDGEPARAFLVEEDGTAVGWAAIGTSERDNLDLAWLDTVVHPDHRRRGVGSAVVGALHDECRRNGRTLVGLDGWDTEGTRAFAASVGYDAKSVSVSRRQPVHDLGPAFFEAAYAEAAPYAEDYELLRIAGRSPEELHEPLALVAASINDAPLDELEMEDEVYSAERIRAFEHAQAESGRRLYRVVARHRRTGELAGHTVASIEGDTPTHGHQEDTSVVAGHRGHRLGLLLKADQGRWLCEAEPQLTALDTWNAASNDHMVGVNLRLGYEVLARAVEFQRRLAV